MTTTNALHSYLSQPGTIESCAKYGSGIEGDYCEYQDEREIGFTFHQNGDKAEIMLDVFRQASENRLTGPFKLILQVSPQWDADGDYVGEEWIKRAEAQAFGKKIPVDIKREQVRYEQIAFDLVKEFFSTEDAAEYRTRG